MLTVLLAAGLACAAPAPDSVVEGEVTEVRYIETRTLPRAERAYHLTVAGPKGDVQLRCVDTWAERSCQFDANTGRHVELWCYEDSCTVAATFDAPAALEQRPWTENTWIPLTLER